MAYNYVCSVLGKGAVFLCLEALQKSVRRSIGEAAAKLWGLDLGKWTIIS
jgi:hypothetical protein